jgi:hypothetical protein
MPVLYRIYLNILVHSFRCCFMSCTAKEVNCTACIRRYIFFLIPLCHLERHLNAIDNFRSRNVSEHNVKVYLPPSGKLPPECSLEREHNRHYARSRHRQRWDSDWRLAEGKISVTPGRRQDLHWGPLQSSTGGSFAGVKRLGHPASGADAENVELYLHSPTRLLNSLSFPCLQY